jgi:hypothetical protein
MSDFTGRSDEYVATCLLKRLVQCVGRAFFEDDKIAILDVLNEKPHYLRNPPPASASASSNSSSDAGATA